MRFLLVLSLILSWSSTVFGAGACEYEPFPPYPPSPPEFTKPLVARVLPSGVFASWQDIRSRDGYLLAICKESEGVYRPLASGLNNSSMAITDLPESGNYYLQVKAYVNVDGNFVFNTGQVSKFSWSVGQAKSEEKEGTPEKGKSSEIAKVQVSSVKEPGTKVSYSNTEVMENTLPEFTVSRSFYSPKYPAVMNPLVPVELPSGELVPPLLTDEGITVAVKRIHALYPPKRLHDATGAQVASLPKSSQEVQKPAEKLNQNSNEVPPVQTGNQVENSSKNEKVAGQNQSSVETGQPEKEGKSPENTQDKGSDLIIYIIVGLIVLAFIWIIFHKEAK